MGDIANIVDLRGSTRPKAGPWPKINIRPEWARLVPGASSLPASVIEIANADSTDGDPFPFRPGVHHIVAQLRPRFFNRFAGDMFLPAFLDATVIVMVYAIVSSFLVHRSGVMGYVFALGVYLPAFLLFAAEENLYASAANIATENFAVIRTTSLAGLFAALPITPAGGTRSSLGILMISAGNLIALLAVRTIRRRLQPDADAKNVLIVGQGERAQKIANAIQRNTASRRVVKAFMAEHHLRNVYGPSMLSRIAREQFIDEIILCSSDATAAAIAAEQGRRSGLEVRMVPDFPLARNLHESAVENLSGVNLFRIHGQRSPECALAFKRALDFLLAAAGLLAISPALFATAVLIKLDSKGPVLYRAVRIGRKGRRFSCYKFRTMISGADAIKESLRSQNQRQGAFFKIANDPRVTRVGAFLRRYSVDELPQLWNVLRGDMSLVGPRPHPPDDVRLYGLQHLQRLDFVPGITGLWQVTARRDPSFERSVALDVEYIKNWNLWLDARILWRTLFAVFEGSGA